MIFQQAAVEQARQQIQCILETSDWRIRDARGAAMLDQAMFGKNEIHPIRRAEIRRAVTDQQGLGART